MEMTRLNIGGTSASSRVSWPRAMLLVAASVCPLDQERSARPKVLCARTIATGNSGGDAKAQRCGA